MHRMKHFVLAGLLIICTGLGLSIAQNINRALQLSQDPLGAIGVDTSNNVYFPGKILVRPSQSPQVASCGTGPTVSGSDYSGQITEGTGSTTGCAVSFNAAYGTAPWCIIAARTFTTATPISWQTFTTGILTSHAATSAAGGIVFNYFCSSTR